jgi:hypothetical protein
MALRMVDDNNEQDDYVQDSNDTGGRSGGGGGFNIGGLLSFLPLVLGLFKGRGGQQAGGSGRPGGCSGKTILFCLQQQQSLILF